MVCNSGHTKNQKEKKMHVFQRRKNEEFLFELPMDRNMTKNLKHCKPIGRLKTSPYASCFATPICAPTTNGQREKWKDGWMDACMDRHISKDYVGVTVQLGVTLPNPKCTEKCKS